MKWVPSQICFYLIEEAGKERRQNRMMKVIHSLEQHAIENSILKGLLKFCG